MQTQYQLLYRYINETTNTAITNEYDYKETKEFFNPDHKLYFSTDLLKSLAWDINKLTSTEQSKLNIANPSDEQKAEIALLAAKARIRDFQFWFDNRNDPSANKDALYTGDLATDFVNSLISEAEGEREQIILNEMANANKSNNFYIYTGTTKEFHQRYMPDSLGYKVAISDAVPVRQRPSGPDDYSKHFIIAGGSKPGIDGAFYVCKKEYIDTYKNEYTEENKKNQQLLLTKKAIVDKMMFEFYDPNDTDYVAEYDEIPATVTPIESQEVDTLFSSNKTRIVNLDGIEYLIIEAVEYWPNLKLANPKTITEGSGNNKTTSYGYTSIKCDGTMHESTLAAKNSTGAIINDNKGIAGARTTWGTIFYNNIGTVIPTPSVFATENGANLAKASDILTNGSSTTDGTTVLQAFTKYCIDLNETDLVDYDYPKTGVNYYKSSRKIESEIQKRNVVVTSSKIDHNHLIVYRGWKLSDLENAGLSNYVASLSVNRLNITRCPIPEHYESAGTAPYLIKDNYKKITMSPWIVHSIHNSLESAIDKAKTLVSMIGISNVKLIKTVPFDQFVKIK